MLILGREIWVLRELEVDSCHIISESENNWTDRKERKNSMLLHGGVITSPTAQRKMKFVEDG